MNDIVPAQRTRWVESNGHMQSPAGPSRKNFPGGITSPVTRCFSEWMTLIEHVHADFGEGGRTILVVVR